MKKILDFTVKENRRLNADNFLLVLHSIELPEIQAGQFVNVRVDHSPSTFLRRPISVHDVDKKQGLLYLLVKIAGKGTEKLSTLKPGEQLILYFHWEIASLNPNKDDVYWLVAVSVSLPFCIYPKNSPIKGYTRWF